MSNTRINLKISLVLMSIFIGISIIGFCTSCNIPIPEIPGSSQYTTPVLIQSNADLLTYLPGQSGSGNSWDNAFIIENLQIDAIGSGAGLRIENVDLYLIIRNSVIISSSLGPYTGGIQLENCTNIRIMNNEITGFHNGVFVIESSLIEIVENTANEALEDGIHIVDSYDCSATSNLASMNRWYGVTIKRSENIDVINNQVNMNLHYGVYLEDSDSNLIEKNTIKKNVLAGIYLTNSDNNTIIRNKILNNGVEITEISSEDNIIERNKTNYLLEIGLSSGGVVVLIGITLFFILRKKK